MAFAHQPPGTPAKAGIRSSGDRAVVDLATGRILAGRLKPRETGLVRRWIDIRRTTAVRRYEGCRHCNWLRNHHPPHRRATVLDTTVLHRQTESDQ
ncbi:MAG: DUF4160 domain-containing protein [Acidimicrobiales bacterium]